MSVTALSASPRASVRPARASLPYLALLTASLLAPATPAGQVDAQAAPRLTAPREFLGWKIGDDYRLATYEQFRTYWTRLAAESDRMVLTDIGQTAEGRPQLMAIVSSPRNLARLEHYRGIAQRLALAGDASESAARQLAREGRAVVWIDGGLHATEVLGAHQLMETVWQLASRTDEETMRILDDVIILATHANPDGMELVSSWYMQEADSSRRNTNIPRLYQKYIGHDNNRDFFLASQPETRNMARVLYHQWFPQIVYNHHQTGPLGTVMFAPPFRDPFNHVYDPLVPVGIDLVGAAMHQRFITEGKPGVTMRSGANYSTWWNGGLRTTVYFHNMIGLLTETIGSPTPMRIPFVPDQQLPRGDLPAPIEPQEWHFRQSVDYSVTANYAVLDLASRYRETFLYNIWRMGRNSIERGSRDHWTIRPGDIAEVKEAVDSTARAARAGAASAASRDAVGSPTMPFGRGVDTTLFTAILRDPDARDPRAYVIPASQPDFPTATRFVNSLRWNGVEVHRATRAITVNGRSYPAGSYVVLTAQPFRPHVLDMFEPQDHPHDFAYPGGPPRRPYDNAGWTLAYQMGVQFDRILEGGQVPAEALTVIEAFAEPQGAVVTAPRGTTGWLLSAAQNDAFAVTNRALARGAEVWRLPRATVVDGRTYPVGTFYVTGTGAREVVEQGAATLGVGAQGVRARPAGAVPVTRTRIALWDQYGGSMPSGWTRYILEQYGFPYTVVYTKELDAGALRDKYDVLILPSGAFSDAGGGRFSDAAMESAMRTIPAEYHHMLGRVTEDVTLPRLREFMEAGGTVIAVGNSATLGTALGLPIAQALVERAPQGGERRISADKFYVPGSVLRMSVDTTSLATAGVGVGGQVDVMYNNNPTFRLGEGATARGVRRLSWFDSDAPLRSGWAWGQEQLQGTVTGIEARIGQGRLLLYSPEITFRAQPHGTFALLFNALQ